MSATTTREPNTRATPAQRRSDQEHAPPGDRTSARESGDGDRRTGTSSVLLAPFRWLRRKLSDVLRWVKKRLAGPFGSLRRVQRSLLSALRWVAARLPAPVRWLLRLFAPGQQRGFGNRWLLATLAVAAALGLLVALLATPVAAVIALPVAAVWSLVRRIRHRRDRNRAVAAGAPA
jgi:hypothetical protein